ncbi:MAG: hypothetical protein LV481_06820 [Methylacidiphilales bacterium]|nr:hypothetical protein [Candidatus Methylacidiphilales bacterium]
MSFPLVPPVNPASAEGGSRLSPEVEAAITAGIDRDRLKILEIAYYIAGVMTIVGVSFLLIHFTIFLLLGLHPQIFAHQTGADGHQGNPPPPGLFLGLAGVIAIIILLGWIFGAFQIYAGHCMKKRRHLLLVMIVAGFECVFIPWGTALGVFTFIVLNRPTVKWLFERE